jgi:CheY-like chemotaxis protein
VAIDSDGPGYVKRDSSVIDGGRVLVVEDNPINQQIAVAFLGAMGARADAVGDGLAAVQQVCEQGPDAYAAILMDIELPGVDGLEAVRRIRALEGHASAAVIAMSGHRAEAERLSGARSLFNAHLTKPFDRAALEVALGKALAACDALRTPDAPATTDPVQSVHLKGAADRRQGEKAAMVAGGLDLAQLKTIDASALIAILGDAGFVARLLRQLRDNDAGLADEIESALAARRLDEAARLAHRLKGVAGNLRAGAVYAAASELEAMLLNPVPPAGADVARCAETLRASLAALSADIDAARIATARVAGRRGLSDATLRRRMRRLSRLLQAHDLEADDLWEALSESVQSRDAAAADALETAIAALDYLRAGALAKALGDRLGDHVATGSSAGSAPNGAMA